MRGINNTNACRISGVRWRRTVAMAEFGFHYGCIGVRYFQKTLISRAGPPTGGCLAVGSITESGRRNRLTCRVSRSTDVNLWKVLPRS